MKNKSKSKSIQNKLAKPSVPTNNLHETKSPQKNQLNKMGKKGKNRKQNFQPEIEGVIQDERFAHVATDPRYRETSKTKTKIHLDDRFSSVFTDERFYEKQTMDPRGRPVNFSTKENLKKFYQLSEEEESSSENSGESNADEDEDGGDSSDDEDDTKEDEDVTKKKKTSKDDKDVIDEDEDGGDGSSDDEDNTKEDEELAKKKKASKHDQDVIDEITNLGVDYARGESFFSSDSSLDEESSDNEENIEFEWAELDLDAKWDVEGEDVEETYRFAVCNMDWDRVKAVDLLMLFSSFTPTVGSIKCVTIYQSDYGKERLKEEEKYGPQELARMVAEQNKSDDEAEDETENATKSQLEVLRKYQRNRLKYYYACVECDCINTAVHVYKACDRQPFEGAGVCLDLRYIPDDMKFTDEPHDICSSVPYHYECHLRTPNSIFESKPTLNWDETDTSRRDILSGAMTKALKKEKIDEELLRNFIASGSSCEEDSGKDEESSDNGGEKEESYKKFRELVAGLDKDKNEEEEFDKEGTFDVKGELSEDGDDAPVSGSEGGPTRKDSNQNPFERYLEKRQQRRKERKQAKLEKKHQMQKIINSSEEDEDDDEELGSLGSDEQSDVEEENINAKVKTKKKKKSKKLNRDRAETEEDKNLELLLMGENEVNGREHFSMRQIVEDNKKKSKRRLKKLKKEKLEEKSNRKAADDFKIDATDNRFATLVTSGDFNIDPSHPSFKKTHQMQSLIQSVSRKRETGEEGVGGCAERKDLKKRAMPGDVNIQKLKKKMKMSNR